MWLLIVLFDLGRCNSRKTKTEKKKKKHLMVPDILMYNFSGC